MNVYLSSRSAACGLATGLAAAGPSIDADEPFKRAIWISFDALFTCGPVRESEGNRGDDGGQIG